MEQSRAFVDPRFWSPYEVIESLYQNADDIDNQSDCIIFVFRFGPDEPNISPRYGLVSDIIDSLRRFEFRFKYYKYQDLFATCFEHSFCLSKTALWNTVFGPRSLGCTFEKKARRSKR